jgi:hypothetical protein
MTDVTLEGIRCKTELRPEASLPPHLWAQPCFSIQCMARENATPSFKDA